MNQKKDSWPELSIKSHQAIIPLRTLLTQIGWPIQELNNRGVMTWICDIRQKEGMKKNINKKATSLLASVILTENSVAFRCRIQYEDHHVKPTMEASFLITGHTVKLNSFSRHGKENTLIAAYDVLKYFKSQLTLLNVQPHFQSLGERKTKSSPKKQINIK